MTRRISPPLPPEIAAAIGACLLAWAAAIVYATLYPWTGWRAPTVAPFLFLGEGWPRYWTWQDLWLNFVGYVPLGLLAALRFGRGRPRSGATIAATLLAATLCIALETLQAMLPGRVSSLSDVLANTAGGAFGALSAPFVAPAMRARSGGARPAATLHATGASGGSLLLLAWLAAQAHPQPVAFATGSAGPALVSLWPEAAGMLARLQPNPEHTPLFEAMAVAASTFGVGLLAREALRGPSLVAIGTPILAALAIKSAVSAAMLGARHGLAWLNAAAQGGLLAGALALALAAWWPARARMLAAACALLCATLIYGLLPPNVYFESTLASWNQGHWENLNGLMRGIAAVWPFAAIAWCLARLRRRGPRPIIERS
jgi:VanZ family protein